MLVHLTSNYSNLDDLTYYMDSYRKDEVNTMIQNTNFALKIMPGYNTERNALYMDQSNNYMQSTLGDNSKSLMDSYNMNFTYFYIDKTIMFFPKLIYARKNIPAGNSIPMCISASWTTKDRKTYIS